MPAKQFPFETKRISVSRIIRGLKTGTYLSNKGLTYVRTKQQQQKLHKKQNHPYEFSRGRKETIFALIIMLSKSYAILLLSLQNILTG